MPQSYTKTSMRTLLPDCSGDPAFFTCLSGQCLPVDMRCDGVKHCDDGSDEVQLCGRYMMTSSNGNIFRVTGHLCGEFTGLRWIPRTKASDAELWCFFDLCLNKRLRKQSWGWWLDTLLRPLWRHCNVTIRTKCICFRNICEYHILYDSWLCIAKEVLSWKR